MVDNYTFTFITNEKQTEFEKKKIDNFKQLYNTHKKLFQILEEIVKNWKKKYPDVCKQCYKYEYIKNTHVPEILKWEYELLKSHTQILNHIKLLKKCTSEDALKLLPEGLRKSYQLLPLDSSKIHYIILNKTTLIDFMSIIKDKVEHMPINPLDSRESKKLDDIMYVPKKIRHDKLNDKHNSENNEPPQKKCKWPEPEIEPEDLVDEMFNFVFPKIDKIKRKIRFANNIKTDGVGCSILCYSNRPSELSNNKGEKVDSESPFPPVELSAEDKLIGIDPGRRDMIVATAYKKGEIIKIEKTKKNGQKIKIEETVKISTKQYRHKAGNIAASKHTCNILKKIKPEGFTDNLYDLLQNSPTHKDVNLSGWLAYLKYTLKILPFSFDAFEKRSIRRQKFNNFIKRDKALDNICKKVLGLGGQCSGQVFVAFGDGQGCSTGFAYAPVPQSRLRHRLRHIHNARVTLIHEPYTSQKCSTCFCQLKDIYKNVKLDNGKVEKKMIYGIKFCESECCSHDGNHQKFWHRDKNASINMITIYLSLARDKKRPVKFCH